MARVFVSYSHQDERWKDRVVRQLAVLASEGLDAWDDRRIAAGADWQAEIQEALRTCDVAVLLVSADFLTSRFILGTEVPAFLQRRQAQGLRVVPLVISPCAWRHIPWLRAIGMRPTDGAPVSGMSRHDAEAALAALVEEIAGLVAPLGPNHVPGQPLPPERIDLSYLPSGAPHFLGREVELGALDAAWADGGRTAICELVAPGGTGKTALVKRWLEGLKDRGWDGAQRVFAWSFYSQGTSDDRQASEDHFLAQALDWFGVEIDPALNPADKGRHLAQALGERRTLLILDGCEPLQYPPGPLAGELRAPGLKALLAQLAGSGRPGLCVLSTRERIRNLDEWVRTEAHPGGPVLRLGLENLSDADGARLLHALGVTQAGAATIGAGDPELQAASREVRGHALTLSLLGNYLRLAHGGDIRQRDRVDLASASEATGGHAFRVMAAYERWLDGPDPGAGGSDPRPLAALRLLGLFDRPAAPEDLAALRAAPPIPGLTEALFVAPKGLPADPDRPPEPIPDADWNIALARLRDAGLIATGARPSRPGNPADPEIGSKAQASAPARGGPGRDGLAPLDAHPLVREYLAHALKTQSQDAWREGHRRLYERLKASVPHQPEGLDGLQPLYQAVAHGCQAGLWQEVCEQVYRDRILRGAGHDGFYSWRKLAAFGANLGAVACLFAEPWTRPAPALTEPAQGWLLNETAIQLRALGRLGEALGPLRAVAEMGVKQENWENAAIGYGSLSELELTMGQVPEAVADGWRALDHAERSGGAAWRMVIRTTLADALHQQGKTGEARRLFAEAEAMQAELQPQYPRLYSLRGFLYCDLLLAGAEGAAWSATAGGGGAGGGLGGPGGLQDSAEGAGGTEAAADPGWTAACEAVARRAGQTLEWVKVNDAPLLTIALDHLTLARSALYADLLAGRPPGTQAQDQPRRAVDGLRAAGQQQYIALGLLTRAWLRQAQGDPDGARDDLAEAEQIASRGAMALFLADIALYRARLFRDPQALAQARRLIGAHGYRRRLPELAAAEAAAADWPDAVPPPHDGR